MPERRLYEELYALDTLLFRYTDLLGDTVSEFFSSVWARFAAAAAAVALIVGLGGNIGTMEEWLFPSPTALTSLTIDVYDVSGELRGRTPPYSMRVEAELFKGGTEKLSCTPFVRVDGTVSEGKGGWSFDEKDQQLRTFKASFDLQLDAPVDKAELKVECENRFQSGRSLPPTKWKKFDVFGPP